MPKTRIKLNGTEGIGLADLKTHLRELSVAITIGLLKNGIKFEKEDLHNSQKFWGFAKKVISSDISIAQSIEQLGTFNDVLRKIIDNGYTLGKAIYENAYFKISRDDLITWCGYDNNKDNPVDITVGKYEFSLKEESFILENMGLYKLLNCYTGSNYRKRNIFTDYAMDEYENWFCVTWRELILNLESNHGIWKYEDKKKHKRGIIVLNTDSVKFEYYIKGNLEDFSVLPKKCSFSEFEYNTNGKTREQVFSKFIRYNLEHNENYNASKRACAIAATEALVKELRSNLNYNAGLPRFLGIHDKIYYYAKTTPSDVNIYKVPDRSSFGNDIVVETIESYVPNTQANILTTIKNKITGQKLVLRNECRFAHGQFNGTPEAKMYYENHGSLEVIYEKIR